VTTLSELLRAQIAARQINQAQAAKEIDVQPTTFSRWINERDTPHPKRVEALADWLDMSVADLLMVIYAKPGTDSDVRVAAALDQLRSEVAELRALLERRGAGA
jgi:transcriptional regulator with XRE-family HTH domain